MAEFISIREAAERLGVHRNTMARRILQWGLTTRQNPRNLRETLVDWSEIEQHLNGVDPERQDAAE